jgi:hypothetical protein
MEQISFDEKKTDLIHGTKPKPIRSTWIIDRASILWTKIEQISLEREKTWTNSRYKEQNKKKQTNPYLLDYR